MYSIVLDKYGFRSEWKEWDHKYLYVFEIHFQFYPIW